MKKREKMNEEQNVAQNSQQEVIPESLPETEEQDEQKSDPDMGDESDEKLKAVAESPVVEPRMIAYIGSKILRARPMNLGEYNKYRGWKIPDNEDPEREGYLVMYEDNYQSWSPKEVFEAAYRNIDDANFLPNGIVFPAEESTIMVVPDSDYGGAHRYLFRNSLGFKDGKVQYDHSTSFIQFVQKEDDGTMIPGVQSEQLVLALIDRHNKLNNRFPSPYHEEGMMGLRIFLDAQKKRVEDRIVRGVMGDLKK